MKVRVTLELDLPDIKQGDVEKGVKLQEPYGPTGYTWEMAFVIQDIFDHFLNFAICRHLEAVTDWISDKRPVAKHIVKTHKQWAHILRQAEPTMKVEKIS